MAVTRSQTRKASARKPRRKSSVATRSYWKKNACWSRRAATGAAYTVCTGSKGQKGVYKKKGRKTRKAKKAKKGGSNCHNA